MIVPPHYVSPTVLDARTGLSRFTLALTIGAHQQPERVEGEAKRSSGMKGSAVRIRSSAGGRGA